MDDGNGGGQRVLIVGASVRAAAFSALRAGLSPQCADLFADWDLSNRCPAQRIAPYPSGLSEVLRRSPSGVPWMYTGALENHPELLSQLGRLRPLWGNAADVVRRVRDPLLVARVLSDADIAHPNVRRDAQGLRPDGTWLIKPLRGAGGSGIRHLGHFAGSAPKRHRGAFFLQEFVPGVPCAAVYVGEKNGARLVGVSRQLVGELCFGAKPFAYCGSVGPLTLDSSLRRRFEHVGDVLVREFGLMGLFGADCILKDDVPYVVEINPRWTASVEVLEYALAINAMRLHAEAFGAGLGEAEAEQGRGREPAGLPCVGKAILYAGSELVAPPPEQWAQVFEGVEDTAETAMPAVADVPHAGQKIRPGRPMLSLLVTGPDADDCLERLRSNSRVAYWQFAGDDSHG